MSKWCIFFIANTVCYVTAFIIAFAAAYLGMYGSNYFTGGASCFYWILYTILAVPLSLGTYNGIQKLLASD